MLVTLTPATRIFVEDFANNAIRDLAVQCVARSAKTQTVMNCACWAIAGDPGPGRWVTATQFRIPPGRIGPKRLKTWQLYNVKM